MKKLHSFVFCLFFVPLCTFAQVCTEPQQLYSRAWYIAGQVGQFAHVQLWNRGNNIITLRTAVLAFTKLSSASFLYTTMPLPHALTQFGAHDAGGINGYGDISQNGEIRALVDPPTEGGQILNVRSVDGNSFEIFALNGWTIPPGHGLLVRLGETGASLYFSFVWCE